MAKVLICDDEPGLRSVIKRYAQFEGHETTEVGDGMEAVAVCKKESFDVVIMDVMMPELDGFSAVKEIRKTSDVPVIMLSARGEEYDKVLGFELGVDDYVVKPFSSKEIMLRIAAILRRTNKMTSRNIDGSNTDARNTDARDTNAHNNGARNTGGSNMADRNDGGSGDGDGHVVFQKEGFVVDLTAYTVTVDGDPVELAPKVYDLLFFLIRNKNIAIPREKILTAVWGFDYFGDDRTLDTHMKLLRKAMGVYADFIKTIRGLGYRFEG